MATLSQLRVYTIKEGKMGDWVEAWKTKIVPLRRKIGFRIDAAWVIEERNQFVWIMSYDGPDDWQSRDAAYFASPERKAIDPDPAAYIAASENSFLSPIDFPL